ncbi:multiprotein-bridging factor 1 family protein [Streptomyces marokkonensis]|uniref:Multiprotein-bridging factor 1 family protein n=1 Tax=Streptomyces marokkonensis TaxID=324855 RepID=A0ABW6QE93_9ACTN
MSVDDASAGRFGGLSRARGVEGGQASPWAEFGEQLRYYRRRAGLTQRQLGHRVGYDHSVISKWESGVREPSAGVVESLERVLGARGALSALVEPAARLSRPPSGPLAAGFFAPLPGDGAATGPFAPARPAGDWPARLAPGTCPLHGATACAVPPSDEVRRLPRRLRAAREAAAPAVAEPETVHLVLALLDVCERTALHSTSTTVLGTVEEVLRSLVGWAQGADAAGRPPLVLLRIAARYAQLAGRLRMQRGQGALATAWTVHGLHWAEAGGDLTVRATLTTDLCTLARLEGDPASSLGYAQAVAGLDGSRGWIMTLSHMYQARGYAVMGDGAGSRRQAALSRRCLDRLGGRDLAEAPWLADGQGELRVESAVSGGLRDLAVVTGDRATARSAAESAVRALEQVPDGMLPTKLLLTLRLADCHACAGELDAALHVAGPVVEQVVSARRRTLAHELEGVWRRMSSGWGGVREVRELRDRMRVAQESAGGGERPSV